MTTTPIGDLGTVFRAWFDLGQALTTEAQKDLHQDLGHQLDRLAAHIN